MTLDYLNALKALGGATGIIHLESAGVRKSGKFARACRKMLSFNSKQRTLDGVQVEMCLASALLRLDRW